MLTIDAKYFDKNKYFKNCIYLLGIDTFIRLLNKQFYRNSEEFMIRELNEYKNHNNHFLVYPRFNKKTQKLETLNDYPGFIPKGYEDLFKHVHDFRIDISSTEIRNILN